MGGAAKMVYAGKVALNAQPSRQLIEAFGEAVAWDAIVCVRWAASRPPPCAASPTASAAQPGAFRNVYNIGPSTSSVLTRTRLLDEAAAGTTTLTLVANQRANVNPATVQPTLWVLAAIHPGDHAAGA